MVSIWPFGGQDNSPGAFEKKLSSLATQILDHEKRLTLLRNRGRRFKGLWTIYTIIAWVIYATILVLVVGFNRANVFQLTGLGVSPFVVYLVRQILKRYYEWRVINVESSLETLREQQTETIEKLKAATKYDSTQALLDKYTKSAAATGAQAHGKFGPNQPGLQSHTPPGSVRKRQTPTQRVTRTSAAGPSPKQPQVQQRHVEPPAPAPPPSPPPPPPPPIESYYPPPPQHVYVGMPPGMSLPPMGSFPPPPPEEPRDPQWYDRFLDVLLGEDEMSAKNRFALICSNCNQVNGLAPPGTSNIEDIRYICGRCGAENGKPRVQELIGKVAEDQAAAAGGGSPSQTSGVQASKPKPKSKASSNSKPKAGGEDRVVYEDDDEEDEDGYEQVAEGATEVESKDESSESSIEVVKKKRGRPSKRKG
ncbi:hypothetical protein ABW20_dc0103650 [Dactylellina cionopaga]|nr:hypothetical protein ABW20_dc0103650 [Dactylellina cionopaga]